MTEHYRFFDSANPNEPDRTYNAQEFTDYFKALVTTGVMKGTGNQLRVTTAGANMVSSVDTGIAFLLGRYYENDSLLALLHETESVGRDRIDRIVIRMDLSTEARNVKAYIKKGVPGTSPFAPPLTQNVELFEISLAQVLIKGGQTYIDTNSVTDERGKNVICPWAGSKIIPNFDDTALGDLVNKVEKLIEPSTIRTIWIDSVNGSDADGDGTSDYPYRSFLHAFSTLSNFSYSVTIHLKPGTYNIDTGSLNDTYKFVSSFTIRGDTTTPTNINIEGFNPLNVRILNGLILSGLTLENLVTLDGLESPYVRIEAIRIKSGRTYHILRAGNLSASFEIFDVIANNLNTVFNITSGVWKFSNIKGNGNVTVFDITGALVMSDALTNTITGTSRVIKKQGGQFFES
ncbi:MAG: hypothetical protein ABS938_08910 [Psychrobacillus psychrodurans]